MFSTALIAKIFVNPKDIKGKIDFERKLHKSIKSLLKAKPQANFIYLGANDGKLANNIYRYVKRYEISGLFVEPQPEQFKRLQNNYKNNPRVQFENSAVSNKTAKVSMYVSGLGFSSSLLRPEHFRKIRKSRLNRPSKKYIVEGITFAELIKKYEIKCADMIFIDTEGYDFEILKQIDLKKLNPALVLYESILLGKKDRSNAQQLLEGHGFITLSDGVDTLAYKE